MRLGELKFNLTCNNWEDDSWPRRSCQLGHLYRPNLLFFYQLASHSSHILKAYQCWMPRLTFWPYHPGSHAYQCAQDFWRLFSWPRTLLHWRNWPEENHLKIKIRQKFDFRPVSLVITWNSSIPVGKSSLSKVSLRRIEAHVLISFKLSSIISKLTFWAAVNDSRLKTFIIWMFVLIVDSFYIEPALYEVRIVLTWKTWGMINVEIYVKNDISNKSLWTS